MDVVVSEELSIWSGFAFWCLVVARGGVLVVGGSGGGCRGRLEMVTFGGGGGCA